MCFSVGASFLSGVFLLGIGIATINHASKKYIFISMVPIFFAIQQFCEGIIWLLFIKEQEALSQLPLKLPFRLLSFPKTIFDTTVHSVPFYILLKKAAITMFLIFALIIWPIWIPLSFYVIEFYKERKKILLGLLILGACFSLYLAYTIFLFGVPHAVVTKHIVYRLPSFSYATFNIGLLIYCVVTLLPFFISSIPQARFIGILMTISMAVSYYFWYAAFTSVWCFFAALISGSIFLITSRKKSHY